MINWLFASLLPLTLIFALIFLVRKPLKNFTDAITTYAVWSMVPLSLALYHIPLPWQKINHQLNNNIYTYVTTVNRQVETQISNHQHLDLWLSIIWQCGFGCLLAYWLFTHVNLHRKLRLSQLSQQQLRPLVDKLPKGLTIMQSSHVHSPVLMGLFNQTLIIPEDFDQIYDSEQQQLIIAHEVCHYAHYHMWTNQLALLLLALFWFHPLAWRAYHLFRQDQEHCCDQLVLAHKQVDSRIKYCKALVCAAETSPPNSFTLMSFKPNGESTFMFNRINQIKTASENSTKSKPLSFTAAVLLSTSLLTGISYAGSQVSQQAYIEQLESKTYPLRRVEPVYPELAAQQGIEGGVLLSFDILTDGKVTNVKVKSARPLELFDQSAIDALSQWIYNNKTGQVVTNQQVQLDYVLDKHSANGPSLVERIKVTR